MGNIAMEIEGLSKSYTSFRLNNINMSVPVGAVVGLVGQNGAGKSTLIKSALGLVRKDAGRVLFPCISGNPAADNIRAYVGYVPESLTFYEWMKVRRLIRFMSAYYLHWDQNYCESLLARYELDPDKQVKHLSRGMRAKLALLLALAHRPPVLILDEPTSGLDPVMRYNFLQELRYTITNGAAQAVLISSHILGEIERVADRIAVLRAGELVLYTQTTAILDQWKKVVFLPPRGDALLLPSEWRIQLLSDGRRMVMAREHELDGLTDLLKQQGAQSIAVTYPDLQEVFLQVA